MSRGDPKLPPFAVLARALRDTTERLAVELVTPTTQAPRWNELEWRVARAAAAIQGTSALLANQLRWQGPSDWQRFLEQQREFMRQRELGLDRLMNGLGIALRAAGIGAVTLKGAALRRMGLYGAGERPMSDVDILIATANGANVAGAMQAVGYGPAYDTPRHRVFTPREKAAAVGFGEHPSNPHEIEVHTEITEKLPVRAVDISALIRPALLAPGLNPYPDRVALFTHLLLHAAGNICARTLRQLQLHDLALLAAQFDADEWRRLLEPARHGSWWMWPPLALLSRYYPDCIPASVLDSARAAAGPLLRQSIARMSLTQVSLSNLRIAAFPGITWSRSAGEALSFARSRILPSREGLAEIDQMRETRPQYNQVRWYGEKHLVRILRWVFTRPPRVQTMITLHGVLGEVAGKA